MNAIFNKAAERIFNIPAHEMLSPFMVDVMPHTGGKLLDCLKTGRVFYREKLKGEKVTLISNINLIVKNGKISGVVSVFQDSFKIESISKETGLI